MSKIDKSLIPARWMPLRQKVNPNGYIKTGERFINKFNKLNLFKKDSIVLEAGCGPGRIAIHFLDKLDPLSGGEFHGFDCSKEAIEWTRENISKKHTNFIFEHLNVYNSSYNSNGNLNDPNKVVFPYEDGYFDFLFSTSLFTHLTKLYTERYLSELFRVAKPGATVFSTFFVFDNEEPPKTTGDLVGRAPDAFFAPQKLFEYDEVSRVTSLADPSAFIAYKKNYLEKLITNIGFTLLENPLGFQAQWIFKKEVLTK